MLTAQFDDFPFETLLDPLAGDCETGASLQIVWGGPLYAVKEARDDAEKCEIARRKWQIEEIQEEPKIKPDWGDVIKKAVAVLTTESKDLRAMAWLSEGLIRVHGLAGLKLSLSLCVDLATRYWDALHPQADEEGGHSEAISGLRKLFGGLTLKSLDDLPLIEAVPDTPAQTLNEITFQQYRNLDEYDRITEEEKDKKERRRVRLEWVGKAEYRQVAERASIDHLQASYSYLTASLDLINRFDEFLKDHCRPDRDGLPTSPDNELSQFRRHLEEMAQMAGKLLRERDSLDKAGQPPLTTNSPETSGSQAVVVPAAISHHKPVATREDAFRAIEEIAAYFEKQEPHSPVHFGLRQIVRWGRMSFTDLLKELLDDDKTLESVRKRVGLPPD